MARTPRAFRRKTAQPVRREPAESWLVGEILAQYRQERQLTLRDLSDRTRELDPEGKGVPHTQIHRIEKDAIVPDLRELNLLCSALKVELTNVIKPEPRPWFLVRRSLVDKLLKEVEDGKRVFHRIRGAHQYMIEEVGAYRYVPLDDSQEYVQQCERAGNLHPVMRKFLFEVSYAEEETVERGLDSHEGEEIVYVLTGELEFFIEQQGDRGPTKLMLREGDCLQYSSDLRHGYRSKTKGSMARALFVYVEPKSPTGPQFVPDQIS